MTTLVLPYPISANAYWRSFVPKGWSRASVYVTREAKAYKEHCALIAKTAGLKPKGHTKFALDVRFYQKDNRRFDIDNVCKITLDALKGVVYDDDSQVQRLHAEKMGPSAQPRLEVEVREYAAA